eukprot:744503-Rhodomonas_salina.1
MRESNETGTAQDGTPEWAERPPVYGNETTGRGRHLLGARGDRSGNVGSASWLMQGGRAVVGMSAAHPLRWDVIGESVPRNASAQGTRPKRRPVGTRVVNHHRTLLQQQAADARSGWPLDWSVFLQGREPSLLTCELYDIAEYSIGSVYASMQEYYAHGYVARNATSLTLRENLMPLAKEDKAHSLRREGLVAKSQEGTPQDGFALYVVDGVVSWGMSLGGLGREQVVNFLDPPVPLEVQIKDDLFTFPRLMYDMGHCHVQRLMTCDTKPKQLLSTVVICALMLYVVGWVLSLSSGTMVLMMASLLPWFAMWYAYGYSPSCFPMVPTCFAADLVETVNRTLPAKMEWPVLLIEQETCNREGVPYNTSLRGKVNCFKSCATEEFRFRSWEDSLAWVLCDMDVSMCKTVGEWAARQTALAQSYNDTTTYFVQVLHFGNTHLTDAHRVCGLLTGFYIIPVLLSAIWVLFMVAAFVKTIFLLSTRTVLYALQAPPAPAEDPSATLEDEDGVAPEEEIQSDVQDDAQGAGALASTDDDDGDGSNKLPRGGLQAVKEEDERSDGSALEEGRVGRRGGRGPYPM